MSAITFTVPGIPAPQGSKNQFGGEANPRTRPWRAAVSAAAHEAMGGQPLITGPVYVKAVFRFPRTKSHYRTGKNAHLLRPDAPRWHAGTPDLDKLQRAIGDALTGVLLRDDKQIAVWHATKRYAVLGAACEICVEDIDAYPGNALVEAA